MPATTGMEKTSNEEMPPGVGPTTTLLVLAIVAASGMLVLGTITKSGARLGVPPAEVAR